MKIIRVNMAKKTVVTEPLPEGKVLGGRGLVDDLLCASDAASAHPLDAANVIVFAAGLLAGTNITSSGRMSVGGKSPLTGGIKEANVGGTAGHKLGRLGIQGIVVEGKSDRWQILVISKDRISFEEADGLLGLRNYSACDKLIERYGSAAGIIIAGPAGEMRLANSTVAVCDPNGHPSRHAARGGLGAVMGSKQLKAIVVDEGDAPPRTGVNENAFREAAKELTNTVANSPFSKMLNTMGTPAFVNLDNLRGSLPTHNYRFGSFDKAANINADAFAAIIKARGGSAGHGCMSGCAIRCSNIYNDPEGNYLTSGVEYETIALLGSNLGIDDLDAIARMDRKCDELGIDTIELGSTIGVLSDVGLFRFGDTARAEELLEEIAQGTPMGRIIGSGVATVTKIFGIERVPAVKGLGLPGHSARSMKGWGVTYATSPQGADHTSGGVTEELLSAVGQHERSRNSQVAMAAFDSTGLCLFTFLGQSPAGLVVAINELLGIEWTVEGYLNMGKEMLMKERAFNSKSGQGQTDRLPRWMTREPLPPTNAVFDVPEADLDSVFTF